MTVRYSVTFEFETRAPLEHRGTVSAGQPHACCARAVKAAQRALRPREWTSVVCVLLERVADAEPTIITKRRKPVEVEGVAV